VVWHSSAVTIWREAPGAVTAPTAAPTAVTIGNFDGVHRGHQHVLARTRELAGDIPVVAVTFDPHPLAVVAPDHAPRMLTGIARRVALLREAGADEVRVLAFGAEMAAWSPASFVQSVVVEQLGARAVVVGSNFRFGRRAAGDVDLLRRMGESGGFAVDGIELDGGEVPFSSTLVRRLVAEGDMRAAASVLGRPHELSGVVVPGDRRGRDLGFPTANVPVDDAYCVPPDGVYAGHLVRASGERLPAAISVGTNPTFDGTQRRVESYVLDRTDLELYGEPVRVELVERIRGMVRFDGAESLVQQMHDDVARTRALL